VRQARRVRGAPLWHGVRIALDRMDDPVAQRIAAEHSVLVPIRDVLRNDQVVRVEAPADGSPGGRRLHAYQPILPTLWNGGRFLADAPRVVAERVIEMRRLAKRAIDQFRKLRTKARIQIDLTGDLEVGGRVGHRAEDGLAADDDELVLARNRRGGAQHVF
jgi:hypothetical protein